MATGNIVLSHMAGVLVILLFMVIDTTKGDAVEGELRLAGGGKTRGRGRVEIYLEGQWGTVCDDFFDMDDAAVVCRQLKYRSAINVYSSAKYGEGSGEIWLDNVRCEGNENRLIKCGNNGWGFQNCDHSEDVSVECQIDHEYGDIRLVETLDSPNPISTDLMKGFVQVYNDGNWLNVCDNRWGITEALVVCRQLGLRAATNFDPTFTNPPVDNVECKANERKLVSCLGESGIKPWVQSECKDAVHVTCSDVEDSVSNYYNNPDKYCWTPWISTASDGLRDTVATLPAIRSSTSVCNGVIPADIECRPSPVNDTTIICDRRQGLICDRTLDTSSCNDYELRLLCPCENDPDPVVFCPLIDGKEYSAGEKRSDPDAEVTQCSQCTCLSEGEWLCGDYDERFCPPPSLTCRRTCDGSTRKCVLEDWVIEWFYGGNSSFCENCLFPPSNLTTSHAEIKDSACPNCITLDGVPRAVAVVNRQLPGPDTQVCEGDTVIVKVINNMKNDPSAGTTIHWHGMFMNGTQYMDGAFMVTQCPIPIGESFTYQFEAVPHGTHWWHSHAGLQRGDGVAGALIVRQHKDPNMDHYDFDKYEHVIVVQDWSHQLSVTEFNKGFYGNDNSAPSTILINGKGGQTTDPSKRPNICQCRSDSKKKDCACPLPQYEQFDVESGKRFRFRVISTAAYRECAMRVSVDGHDITIIATDGASVQPYPCQSFIIFNAERYDFVLNANQDPGNYWMRVTGQNGCKGIGSLAIIHYAKTDDGIPQSSDYKWIKPTDSLTVDSCNIDGKDVDKMEVGPTEALYKLTSAEPNAMSDWEVDSVEADNTYYIGLNFDKVDTGGTFLPQLNNVTFGLPSKPFLLQVPGDIEKGEICRLENREKQRPLMETDVRDIEVCGEGFCACSHVLSLRLGEVVELVFVNIQTKQVQFSACHPMHLHGFNYRVVSQGIIPDNVTDNLEYIKSLNEGREILKRPVKEAIQKDTMVVPINGYTIVQFRADNPGWWFLHCHFEMHLALGMTMVVHVDKEDGESVIPAIPINFPICGNWADDRADEAETYMWSEEHLGDVDSTKNEYFRAVQEKVKQTQMLLQEKVPSRSFDPFNVIVHRVRTDPVTNNNGFFYYLFKIDTGDGTYVHLEFETPARIDPPEPILLGCFIDQTAETPLMALALNTKDNLCPQGGGQGYYSSSVFGLRQTNVSAYVAILIIIAVIVGY